MSPELRIHAAIAIRDRVRRLRRDRIPVPPDLIKFGAALVAGCRDWSRQEPPSSPAVGMPWELADGTPAALMLRASDAAALLGCSVRQLQRKTASGEIPSLKDGRSRRYRPEDLAAYVAVKADEHHDLRPARAS
jgi:excisionase family DNA binding protein